VIFKMLRMPDDGNTHAFAANIIALGGFAEYEAELLCGDRLTRVSSQRRGRLVEQGRIGDLLRPWMDRIPEADVNLDWDAG
jgi:hypothetical protein